VAGSAAARRIRATILTISVTLSATMVLFPLLGASPMGGVVLLILWGLTFGGVSVSLQTWVLKAAPHATEAASALWVSMFNLSIALGALIGGRVVDTGSLPSVLWVGGALVLLSGLAVTHRPRRTAARERISAPRSTG
jgi:predicted MFS family arabinose efflux permease